MDGMLRRVTPCTRRGTLGDYVVFVSCDGGWHAHVMPGGAWTRVVLRGESRADAARRARGRPEELGAGRGRRAGDVRPARAGGAGLVGRVPLTALPTGRLAETSRAPPSAEVRPPRRPKRQAWTLTSYSPCRSGNWSGG